MLTSSALVLMMTIPGLALFYGGMVRKKNVLATLMQSFVITCLVTILWWFVGYSIAFTPGPPGTTRYLGGFGRVFMHGVVYMHDAMTLSVSHLGTTIPETVYAMFQLTFAIITPALICGAFAERMKFSAMLWFMGIWLLLVYCPIAHWVWEPSGWLSQKGVLDFAGGTVVHINAGIAGLVGALIIGKRTGYGKDLMAPHSLTMSMIGASLLWVGWFGFNAGSNLEANGGAALAMTNSFVATAAAALSWMFAEWMIKGHPSVLGAISGAVAGLVAVTPAAGYAGPMGAIVLGLVVGVVCLFFVTVVKNALGYDDSLDVFGVHCIGGIVGALGTGILVNPALGGAGIMDYTTGKIADYDFTAQMISQCWGVGTTLVWSGIGSAILYKVVDVIVGLRANVESEREGLDITEHTERAYNM
jgi:Amt family ammonium transporter